MGRPPKAGVAATESLNVRVTKRLMERIDEVRGTASRSDWARGVLSTAVGAEKVTQMAKAAPAGAHRHIREVVEPAVGNRPAVVRCKTCKEPL